MKRVVISILVTLSLLLGTLPALAGTATASSAPAVATSRGTQAPASRARATGKEDADGDPDSKQQTGQFFHKDNPMESE